PPARRGAGRALGVLAAVVAVMLALGAAAYLFLGDDSGDAADSASPGTDPVFSDPAKVVDRWLNAMFILKDVDQMIRYTCKKEADRAEVEKAVKGVRKAEQDAKAAKLSMKVSWSAPTEESRGVSTAKVTSTLKVVVGKKADEKHADFDLVDEAGWKVCDAEMTSPT
ncbi:MAG: hypothetical protein ACRDT6_27520, partial [Micromonosporaceae bacterium]